MSKLSTQDIEDDFLNLDPRIQALLQIPKYTSRCTPAQREGERRYVYVTSLARQATFQESKVKRQDLHVTFVVVEVCISNVNTVFCTVRIKRLGTYMTDSQTDR